MKPMAIRTLIDAVKGRQGADHLSGGPHHRHRQPDEGLRRRRHDRRQGRCRDRAGAHRGPGADAVQPIVARDRCAGKLVPQGDGDDSRAGASSRSIPTLKGRKRRQAAGAALYGIMSDLVFRTTSTDRTVMQAVIEAAATARPPSRRGRRSRHRRAHLQASAHRRRRPRQQADADGRGGTRRRRDAAERKRRGGHASSALMSAGRVPAMINFTAGAANILAACRAAQIDTILTSRAFIEKAKLTNLVAIIEKEVRIVYLEDVRASITFGDKIRGLFKANQPLVERKSDDWAAILFTSGSEGVPKGRRAVPPQHAGQCRAGGGAHRLRLRGQGVQRAAGVPLVRAYGRRGAAARLRRARSISTHRRCTIAPWRS